MVGVPRSTGCATCVKRRVKCDETKPHCLRCQKSNRSCPGYTKRFLFKQSSLAANYSGRLLDQSSSSPEEEGEGQLTVQTSESLVVSPDWSTSVNSYELLPVLSSPLAQQSQLMGNFILAFQPAPMFKNGPSRTNGSWLSQVHDRIGTSVPQDLSMRSLACLYNGLGNADPRFVMAGRALYVRALQSLRTDMISGKSSQSDIQSSAMLLTFYELMSNRREESWIKHCINYFPRELLCSKLLTTCIAGGASQIMKIRGPNAYRSGFDYAMYLVCRSYIMIEAFITDSACFLEEPEWEALTQVTNSPQFLVQERMFTFHAKVPRLLRDAQRANRGECDAADVIQRAVHLRNIARKHFDEWWDQLGRTSARPIEKASSDDLFPTTYWFPNILITSLLCSHHATLSLVNQLLIDSGHAESESLVEENQAAAAEICKCVEQAQTRLLGAIYMPFWLRVASDTCAPEHYSWIMAKWDYFRTKNIWSHQVHPCN